MNIKSRYSLKRIPNNYGVIQVSGSNYPMTTLNSGGTFSQGCVFVPYIISEIETVIYDREYYRKILRDSRIEKLNNIKCLSENETK